MSRLSTLRNRLPDPRTDAVWRYALLGGGLSVPFTLVQYWRSTGATTDISLVPVLLGAALAGYLYGGDRDDGETVGARAGLVASVGLLPLVGEFGYHVVFGVGSPGWGLGPGVLFLSLTLGAFIGFTALVGLFGGVVGRWLAEKTEWRPPLAARR